MTSVVPGALRAALSVPGLVLLGAMVGFGGFAHGAGWPLFETLMATVVIWALPAQVILLGVLGSGAGIPAALAAVSISSIRLLPMVCSILPAMRGPRTGLVTQVVASHFVAQTIWILTLLKVEVVERKLRPQFYFWMAGFTVLFSTVACGVGWLASERLPRPLEIALLMLTPVSFLLSTEKAARGLDLKLAFVLGLATLPLIHWLAPMVGLRSWEVLATGVVAGGIAFVLGSHRRAAS
jgi:predicted branched-subunit amino acid permease